MQGVEFSQRFTTHPRVRRMHAQGGISQPTNLAYNILSILKNGPTPRRGPREATGPTHTAYSSVEPPWPGLSWRVLGREERGAEVEGLDLA